MLILDYPSIKDWFLEKKSGLFTSLIKTFRLAEPVETKAKMIPTVERHGRCGGFSVRFTHSSRIETKRGGSEESR